MDTATASLENKPLKATVRPPGDAFPGLVYAQHAAVTKKEKTKNNYQQKVSNMDNVPFLKTLIMLKKNDSMDENSL